jgi:predicted ABC-type ATPase
VVVLAGPNGAGKSTVAPALLKETLGIAEFVNADTIARGLAAFDPALVALEAGKIMVRRIRDLAAQRATFAFETTLASRSFAPWLGRLVKGGYQFHLLFLWLPNEEFALKRVANRVRQGGHGIPEETVRRRFRAGLKNLFSLYLPLATTWRVYDNSEARPPRLIAWGEGRSATTVLDTDTWDRIRQGGAYEGRAT